MPAKPWEGVRDAGKPCPKPIQNNYVTGNLSYIDVLSNSLGASCKEEYWMDINPICLGLLEGQEDCLYINVYRPEADEEEEEDEPKELLPVSCTSAKKGES